MPAELSDQSLPENSRELSRENCQRDRLALVRLDPTMQSMDAKMLNRRGGFCLLVVAIEHSGLTTILRNRSPGTNEGDSALGVDRPGRTGSSTSNRGTVPVVMRQTARGTTTVGPNQKKTTPPCRPSSDAGIGGSSDP